MNKSINIFYAFVFIVSVVFTINAQTVPTTAKEIFGEGNYSIDNTHGNPGYRMGNWMQGSNMPFPRYYAASVMYSQSDTTWLYVFGGDTTGSGVATSACLKYNLNTDTWSYIPSLPEPMRLNSAVVVGDKIYVFGGFNAPFPALSIASFYEYDITNNTWSQLPDLPVPLFFSGAESYEDSLIYIFGGITDTGSVSSDVPLDNFRFQVTYFNRFEEEFHEATDMPEATASFGHLKLSGSFYLTGGLQSTTELWDLNLKGDVDPNDKAIINWTKKANSPIKFYANFSYPVINQKEFYILGGSNTTGFTPISSTYSYDITSNNFTMQQNLPINLMAASGGYTTLEGRAPDEEIVQHVVLAGGITTGPALSAQTWIFTDTVTVVGVNDPEVLPNIYSLEQNYPNPFNPSTTISFSLPEKSAVKLEIFNTLGEKVATLVNEELSRGNYEYNWDAAGLSSGIYFYRLETAAFSQSKKMLLIK